MKKRDQEVLIEIPDMAKDLLPEPETLNFYRLQKNRIIYVMGEIEAWLLEIGKMIQLFNIEDLNKKF